MPSFRHPLIERIRGPLPHGTFAVGAGLVVAGLTAYGFLVVSARALGPERYAALSVLWVIVYTAGPGLFVPLEQEVGRALAARRSRGLGGAPVLRRVGLLGAGLVALLLAVSAVAARPAVARLFDGDWLLLGGYALSLVGLWGAHLTRGALAGGGRFAAYGSQLATEGLVRLAACVVLALLAVDVAGPYGLLIGAAPLVAVAVTVLPGPPLAAPGPDTPWREVSGALGFLLVGSVLSQLLVNAGPIAVKLLAAGGQETALAGRFLAALVIARVPLFLFAAVQAALLPRLAGLAEAGRPGDFGAGVRRLVTAVAVIAAAGTLGAVAVGPEVVGLLFGSDYVLGRVDMAYLAAASGVYMVAVVVGHGLIAVKAYARAAAGWLAGIVAFVVVTAAGQDLLLRVERGFLAGTVLALLALGGLFTRQLRRRRDAHPDELIDASRRVALEP